MVLELMQVHNVHCQTMNEVKMFIFLELILVLLCIFIIEKKGILVVGEGPTQELDNSTVTGEAKYPINFTRSGKRSVLRLHYNGSNSFSFVNTVKMYQFKGNDSEIKPCEVIRSLFYIFYL